MEKLAILGGPQRVTHPLEDKWRFHVIDDGEKGGVNGVHGLITGDVDGDGKLDLIGNSGQPKGAFPNSIAWYTRMGFRNAGPIVQDIGAGYVMDDYRMEKVVG